MDTLNRTDINGKPIVERRAWSFSALDKFTNCARKFYHYDIAKDVKEPESPQMKEGFKVHKAMADFISKDIPLPPEYARFSGWVPTPLAHDDYLTEYRLACTYQLKPCDYFSRKDKVWLRAQADLLIINSFENTAISIDWKTGSEKDPRYELLPPNFQLKLTALLIFLHFPKVQTINSRYVYLYDGVKTDFDVTREQIANEFLPQMMDLEHGFHQAVKNNDFPPRQSGLCKRHCAVFSCEHNGRKS